MKHNTDELFLRSAFRQEPEACHTALMHAANSVFEDKKVKRAPIRAIWIAVIILIAMTAVAFAMTGTGLMDWFWNSYGTEIPQAAQNVLATTEQKTLTAGPIAFTIKETLVDGRVAYLTVEAGTADGSAAILYMGNSDPSDSIGKDIAAILDTDDIIATTTFIDAARIAGLPLYSVLAWLEPAGGIMAGEEMMDAAFQEDGSILLIDMLYTDPDVVGDVLTADIVMLARELDPETLERKNDGWKAVDTRTIPVNGVVAKRTYAVSSKESLGGYFTVTKVTAEQTCAGVYITVHATVEKGITLQTLRSGICFYVLDAQGNSFPTGISLTSECLNGDGSRFPVDPEYIVYSLQYRMMITVDTLPEKLIISNGNAQILVEAIPPVD